MKCLREREKKNANYFFYFIYTHTYKFQNTCCCYNANEIAMRMKEMLMSGILHESGWTLVGNLSLLKLFIEIILLNKKKAVELF